MNLLLNGIYNSVNYVLGQNYYKDIKKYVKIHDAYNSFFFGGMTTLMCISYVLIIPFVTLYTRGVTDVEYINPSLPFLFCLVQILSWSRYIAGNLSGIAGYAKQTSVVSMVEAIINVICSIILVQKYGITGVLLATVLALPLKVIYLLILSDKVILKRSMRKSLIIMMANLTMFAVTVVIRNAIVPEITSYLQFIFYGIVYSLIFAILGILVNVTANKDCLWAIKILRNK